MALHTPSSEKKFTYSEYCSINNAYSGMINESVQKSMTESVVDKILGKVYRKSLGKIRKCAKKSAKLATYATQTALNEACEEIDCDADTLSEARSRAKKILRCKIGENFDYEDDFDDYERRSSLGEIEDLSNYRAELDKIDREVRDRYGDEPFKDDGSFENLYPPDDLELTEDSEEEREFRGEMDFVPSDDGDGHQVEIDDGTSEETDGSDDSEDTEVEYSDTEGAEDSDGVEGEENSEWSVASDRKYKITCICVGMSDGKKLIGDPVKIEVDEPEQDLTDMDKVVDFVNESVGFYFEPNDYYCDFAKVADGTTKRPKLCAKKSLTSDSVQGSEALNKFFGNDGRFADYLYKADGTAKEEPSEVDGEKVDDIEADVSVVKKFPTLHIMVWILSTSEPDGQLRDIVPEDFAGTEIRVIE